MNYQGGSAATHVAHQSYPLPSGYQESGFFPSSDYAQPGPPPPPPVIQVGSGGGYHYPHRHHQQYDYPGTPYDNQRRPSFLRACLAALCCCCVLEECCI